MSFVPGQRVRYFPLVRSNKPREVIAATVVRLQERDDAWASSGLFVVIKRDDKPNPVTVKATNIQPETP